MVFEYYSITTGAVFLLAWGYFPTPRHQISLGLHTTLRQCKAVQWISLHS